MFVIKRLGDMTGSLPGSFCNHGKLGRGGPATAAFVLETGQCVGGRHESAATAGFVTAQKVELARVVGEGPEGKGNAAGGVDGAEVFFDPIALFIDLEVEERGFDGDEAFKTPSAAGDFKDELGFGSIGGLEGTDIAGEELVERVLIFLREDDA